MRGEQIMGETKEAVDYGSPPLARGTVTLDAAKMHLRRITPACAGNSEAETSVLHAVEDHPRLRGEQVPPEPRREGWIGSPPLARGTEKKQKRAYLY